MANWKKWLIRSVATFLILLGILFAIVLDGLNDLSDEMCATTIFDQSPSPSGKLTAVLYEIDCGATTGFNRHISIVSVDTDLKKKNPNLGTSPFALRGDPNVKMRWPNSDQLEIQYPESASVIRAEGKSKGVLLDYKRAR